VHVALLCFTHDFPISSDSVQLKPLSHFWGPLYNFLAKFRGVKFMTQPSKTQPQEQQQKKTEQTVRPAIGNVLAVRRSNTNKNLMSMQGCVTPNTRS
jgi:hypothetical protein